METHIVLNENIKSVSIEIFTEAVTEETSYRGFVKIEEDSTYAYQTLSGTIINKLRENDFVLEELDKKDIKALYGEGIDVSYKVRIKPVEGRCDDEEGCVSCGS